MTHREILVLTLAAVGFASHAQAADLTIHLDGAASVSRKTVEYQCDSGAAKIGLPAGSFSVEYINAGKNSLVVIPISGHLLIFSSVLAASGVRYTAQTFTWCEAGGRVTLSSDSLAGKAQATCRHSNK